MDEQVVEIPELEAALEERLARKVAAGVSARTVTFETKPTSRVTITFLGEDEDTDAGDQQMAISEVAPAPPQVDSGKVVELAHRAKDARGPSVTA